MIVLEEDGCYANLPVGLTITGIQHGTYLDEEGAPDIVSTFPIPLWFCILVIVRE